MKKILAILSLTIYIGTLQAQMTDADTKLLAKYTSQELNSLKKESPQEYEFVKFCTDNAFYVAALSKEKVSANPTAYGEVTIEDISSINFFELKIELKQSDFQAFVIKGANKLLIIRSKDYILQELKKK